MPAYETSPGRAIAARRARELVWEKRFWRMLANGIIAEQDWGSVGLTLQAVEKALDGHTTRDAYDHLLPFVRGAATSEYNMEQLRAAPIGSRKKWVARMDGKTRPAHRDLNGQTTELAAPFRSGPYALYYPGDESAPIELWVRCRCVLVIVPKARS